MEKVNYAVKDGQRVCRLEVTDWFDAYMDGMGERLEIAEEKRNLDIAAGCPVCIASKDTPVKDIVKKLMFG